MPRPICSCGLVMYTQAGYTLCLHCEAPPKQTITSCHPCKVYHHTVDMRVIAEHQAESARHNQ